MRHLYEFPKNRYEALNEVRDFLEYNGIDLGQAFEVLLNSSDGYLIYNFGDIEIQFTRGFGMQFTTQNAIQLLIELDNGVMRKTATYEYEIKDLKPLRRKISLKNFRTW